MPTLRLVARFGIPGGLRLPRFLLASALAHATFVTILVLAPAMAGRHKPSAAPLVVGLVAPAVASSGPRAAKLPSAHAPVEKGLRAAPKAPPPLPPPPKKINEKPKKAAEEKPKPAARSDADTTPAETRAPETPSPIGAVPGGTGTGITPLGGAVGDELDWYRSLVASALQAQWRKPILDEGASGAVEVTVTCEIERDGTIRDLKVASPSGVPSLDRSAQRAVLDAVPLPPLPPTWTAPSLSAGFVFQLSPE